VGRLQAAFRNTMNTNANIARTVFGERGLAPEYPLSRARPLRLNGVVGMEQTLDLSSWRLQLSGIERPEQYPLYAKDVTAWEYQYQGAMAQDQQALDVKSAPKSDTKLDPGDEQPEPVDGPKVGPGVPPDVKNRPRANSLNPGGAVDSAAGAAIAERFEAMARAGEKPQTKRRMGNAEAGASYSSLDIGTPGLLLAMSDLQKLPKVEMCLEFKCIEGWSEITQWGGYRLRDLLEMYPPAKVNGRDPKYVYMETPDGNYYGGYDLAVARHSQSLLATEMGGQPLTQEHGAPLRLYTPLKYGYKQVKRIGLIAYTDQKPDDFWTKLGYDWYAGL
jgi:DMSO/TMAO reductase YedYZ molybdopterin-dependent catalytic subunit